MSLMPFITDLEHDLWEENIGELHRKKKDFVGFPDIVDLLANTSLPCVWPLSGLTREWHGYYVYLQVPASIPAPAPTPGTDPWEWVQVQVQVDSQVSHSR